MSKRFSYHLKRHFQTVDMNPYRLAKATGMHEQYVYKICRGEQRPSDEVLNKFSSVPELKVTLGELRGWRALDDYSWAELILAISAEAWKLFWMGLPPNLKNLAIKAIYAPT